MEKKSLKKIVFLPNVVTAFGLSCGLFVIFKMNMIGIGQVNMQILTAVTMILLLAAFADLLDGAIARVIKAESEFGGVFDTLADAISFGVAPSVIILKTLSVFPGTKLSFLITMAAIIFSLCGVLRLVRFNVSALAAKESIELKRAQQKHFTGLPIPAAAAAAISLNLFLFSEDIHSLLSFSIATETWILALALIFLGYCMVSRWKFPSIKTLEIRVSSFRVIFFTALAAVFIFYGVVHHFVLMFVILAWSYVIIAWILAILRVLAGRRSKTLEAFEPEPEDALDDYEIH